jgi:hypothetical protein
MAFVMRDYDDDYDKRARDIYLDPKKTNAFGNAHDFVREIGGERDRALTWLSAQDAYTYYKPVKGKFPRQKTIINGPGQQLQADLMDVSSHAAENDGTKFLLTAIDVFSRFAWAVPIKNKTGLEVARALDLILKDPVTDKKRSYRLLQTDKGKEFKNARVQELLKTYDVHWFSTENETIKASMVERFNKTLRIKIHRYLTSRRTDRYLDVLDDLVDGYNQKKHSSTRVAPKDVTNEMSDSIFVNTFEKDKPFKKQSMPKFQVGDYVRISRKRQTFERGYTQKWTSEIFVVDGVDFWKTPIVYRIKDLGDDKIEGTFYAQELQKVKKPETFLIEKIIRRRGKGSKQEMFVKWLGYPERFNSWVPASDFV